MKVHIYGVIAKTEAGNILFKYTMAARKDQNPNKVS